MNRLEHVERLIAALPKAPPERCGYFPARTCVLRAFSFAGGLPPAFFDHLLAAGFRRCGPCYYRPQCPGCRRCVGYRIPVHAFRPTRSQRRLLGRRNGLSFAFDAPHLTREKEQIYLRYQRGQHRVPSAGPDARSDHDLLAAMHLQMYRNPPATREFEIRLPNRRLAAFGTIDLGHRAASAVYTVFDPELATLSLGSLAILRSILHLRDLDIPLYYMGYYIRGHAKMEYKQKFGPGQWLSPDWRHWQHHPPPAEPDEDGTDTKS